MANAAALRDALLAHTPIRPHAHTIFDFLGQTTLSELSALTSLYTLFIGVDSGPYHLALAHGVGVVELAPTKAVRPIRWGPWRVPQAVVRSPLHCNLYCNHHRCPVDDCLVAITPVLVADAAERVLREAAEPDFFVARGERFKKSQTIVLVDSGAQLAKLQQAVQTLQQDPDIRYVVWDWAALRRDCGWNPLRWYTVLINKVQCDDVTTFVLDRPTLLPLFAVLRLLAPSRVFVSPLLVLLPAQLPYSAAGWMEWLIEENGRLTA